MTTAVKRPQAFLTSVSASLVLATLFIRAAAARKATQPTPERGPVTQ
jgi:hypothetical protein